MNGGLPDGPAGLRQQERDAARIAMWSGPRTVSTALMRSWENRRDTLVVDEPLYAYYLVATGLDHPGREEVIASQPADWRVVLRALAEDPLPPGISVCYQKHMTHHLLAPVDRAAFAPLRHAFLIRDPRWLLASYARVRAEPTLDDLGLRQQVEIFEEFGGPVIDSADLLAAPEASLRALCAALGLPFSDAMLSWPPGPRDSDGVWAPYWYDSVRRSTGFVPVAGPQAGAGVAAVAHEPPRLAPGLTALAERCMPYYERLGKYKLVTAPE